MCWRLAVTVAVIIAVTFAVFVVVINAVTVAVSFAVIVAVIIVIYPRPLQGEMGLQQEPNGYDMTKSWLRMLQETYYAMAFVIPFCIQVRILIMVAFRLVQIIGNNTISFN